MISAPQSNIVKRRLKGKVRIGDGRTAQGTSVLGAPAAAAGPLWGGWILNGMGVHGGMVDCGLWCG